MSPTPDSGTVPAASPVPAPLRPALGLLFGSALLWLLTGNLLGLLAALGLLDPGWNSAAALTYGRLAPAARTAWLAGWASLGSLGVVLAVARTGRVGGWSALLGALLWNGALLGGIAGILGGAATGLPGLEMPRASWSLLLFAYLLIALPTLGGLGREPLNAARLHFLGALVAFPLLLSIAGRLLLCAPVAGSAQPPILAWFGQGWVILWLVPVALGAFYHFLPPRHEGIARAGFWTLMLAGGWSGAARLVEGPAPAWIASAGVAAQIALLVPALAVALAAAEAWREKAAPGDLAPRFLLAAALAFVVWQGESFLTAFRLVNPLVRFTWWETARAALVLYGVSGLALFGALERLLPALIGRSWGAAEQKARVFHFHAAWIGLVFGVGALAQGGLLQGLGLLDPHVPFAAVSSLAWPFLGIAAGALGLLLAAHLALVCAMWSLWKGER